MYLGFTVNFLFGKAFDGENIIKSHQVLDLYLTAYVLCLFTERNTVNKEQNTLKAFGFDKAVDKAEDGTGFTCAGSHRKQHGLLTFHNGIFGSLDGTDLIFTQIKTIGITQQVIRGAAQGIVCRFNVLIQHFHNALGTDPALQGFGSVRTDTKILEPDAGFCFDLFQIFSAVGGEDKGNLIRAPMIDDIFLMGRFNMLCVCLALKIQHTGDIGCGFLGFYDCHELKTDKQSIIGIAGAPVCGIGGPFGNGKVPALLGTGAFGVAVFVCVSLPAEAAELFVNEIAGLCLGKIHALRNGFRFLGAFLFALFRGGSLNGGINLSRQSGNALFLLFDNGFIIGDCLFLGHNKGRRLKIPFAVNFHKPSCKVKCHFKQGLGIVHRGSVIMNGVVSGLAQGIQNIADLLR